MTRRTNPHWFTIAMCLVFVCMWIVCMHLCVFSIFWMFAVVHCDHVKRIHRSLRFVILFHSFYNTVSDQQFSPGVFVIRLSLHLCRILFSLANSPNKVPHWPAPPTVQTAMTLASTNQNHNDWERHRDCRVPVWRKRRCSYFIRGEQLLQLVSAHTSSPVASIRLIFHLN